MPDKLEAFVFAALFATLAFCVIGQIVAPRVRAVRAKKKAEEAFAEIIRYGGEIVCSPDTFAMLDRLSGDAGTFAGVKIRTSNLVPRGMLYAISQRAIPEFPPSPRATEEKE